MAETVPIYNPASKVCVLKGLRRFRNLYYRRDIQRGPAAAALLASRNSGELPSEVELGGNRVRADRAMSQPLGVVCNHCLHVLHPYKSSDANLWAEVVKNIVKILK